MSKIELAYPGSCFNRILLPDGVIHWSEAKEHIGDFVTIYGEVASTYFDEHSLEAELDRWSSHPEVEIKVPPTFIEIGAKFPNTELLKVVIWGRNRANFKLPPDILYNGKAVIIKGKPYVYNGLVHVAVATPKGMKIAEPIEGLYELRDTPDDNWKLVFETAIPSEDDAETGWSDEAWEWESEYTPRTPDYYDRYTGERVDKLGDYYYDDDGNCIPDDVVEERFDYDW